jgi:hypothetical protein
MTQLTPEQLVRNALHRRAVEAVIWGMPAVNTDLMYQAMAREVNGSWNQIVYWSRLLDWKNQTLTPNPDAIYLMPFFNTAQAGPMVIEIPPADGAQSPAASWIAGRRRWRTSGQPALTRARAGSATVYDRATHGLVREMARASRSSQSPGLQVNGDGSVDIYFGPAAPANKQSNRVPTSPDGEFEVLFRFYGPATRTSRRRSAT